MSEAVTDRVRLDGEYACDIRIDGELVGIIAGIEGRLDNVHVREEWREQGVATEALSKWVGHHPPGMEIRTSVVTNATMERVLEKVGFEPTDRIENYYVVDRSGSASE
jgi:RimJ/RimL family protein N-acetyltransferase